MKPIFLINAILITFKGPSQGTPRRIILSIPPHMPLMQKHMRTPQHPLLKKIGIFADVDNRPP